jgi:phenylpyruvate tautomerase PptA (4-oxalocrotonate tautomerase family)
MPIVRIDYEKEKLSKEQMRTIATKLQGLTAQAIGYELTDISVFASENQITINAAPIEIYIYADFPDVTEEKMESMLKEFADSVVLFKKEQGIEMPFNLSIVKMNWKFKLEI